MKIKKRTSACISLIVCFFAFIVAIATTVCLPWIWKWQINTFKPDFMNNYSITLVYMYFVCVFALVASFMLILLLLRVLRSNVFSEKSVALIRGISWCCVGACVPLALCGVYFYSMIFLSFAAAFLGLVLRVVKNVIEEATDLKKENDLTI